MKELVVLSGKGGTGKTTITAAFASLAKDAVLADCDVDAADLHLLLHPEVRGRMEFRGIEIAIKDPALCTECGACREKCRFEAIDENFDIMDTRCEGCGVCEIVCPADAIHLEFRLSGEAYISSTRFGPMSHARLFTAEEASGKLVAMVRKNAKMLAADEDRSLVLIDGPPGIGCPVIASISGTDLTCIVTEPTVSGRHDLIRVVGVARHFKVPVAVIINRYDVNPEMAQTMEAWCAEENIPVIGRMPYDTAATMAMVKGMTIVEYDDDVLAPAVRDAWRRLEGLLYGR